MDLSYILKDARKNREDNRLYFYSLIMVFIVSYTVLSFDKTAISRFLYQENISSIKGYLSESYIFSLIFLLTLIFFASKNQLENRKEEFAILMMMGERRRSISKRLSLEAIVNSLLAILIAFPIAVFLNEFINLFAIKVLELGLRSHRLRISFFAVFITSLVVIVLQVISIRLISFFILRKEAYLLMNGKAYNGNHKEKKINEKRSFFISLIFLAISIFFILIFTRIDFVSLVFFVLSLYFFYRGFPYILDLVSKKRLDQIFEIRLIEEKFKYEYKSLFFTNLLMIVSFTFLTLPLTQSYTMKGDNNNVADFTIYDSRKAIDRIYDKEKYEKILEKPQAFYISRLDPSLESEIEINLIGDMTLTEYYIYLIKESSFNQLMEKEGKDPLDLKKDEAMVVFSTFDSIGTYRKKLGEISEESFANIGERYFRLIPRIEINDIFSNHEVFWEGALVVNDKVYNELAADTKPFACNIYMKSSYKNEMGTIEASDQVRNMMIADGLKYESKIWQLKNDVSDLVVDLYINLYLGLLLFIIANTYIAFKFLYWIKENHEKFAIKRLLGADQTETRKKMERIIDLYFIFLFLISLITNYIYYHFNIGQIGDREISNKYFVYINICLVIFELIYLGVIKKITRDEVEKSR